MMYNYGIFTRGASHLSPWVITLTTPTIRDVSPSDSFIILTNWKLDKKIYATHQSLRQLGLVKAKKKKSYLGGA